MKTIALALVLAVAPGGAYGASDQKRKTSQQADYTDPISLTDAENKANYKACMAEPGHDPADCRWHLKFDTCLLLDNRGKDHDGEEFCAKDGKGMTPDQKLDFDASMNEHYRKVEAERAARDDSPGYKNCMRELDAAKRRDGWDGKPSREDCLVWAEAVRQKGVDMIDKGIKGIMETK